MEIFRKLSYILDRKQKIQLFFLFIIIGIGTFLELLGVTSVLPFINVVMTPEIVKTDETYRFFYEMLNLSNVNYFIAVLAMAIGIVFIVKNLFISFMYYMQYKWTFNNQARLAGRLMECYLKQPYYFHVTHNSSELIRNVNSDTVMMFHGILAVIQLLTEACVCVVLGGYMFIKDKSITIGVSGFLVAFVLLFIKFFKKNLGETGERDRRYNAEIVKWLQQSFGGIKETKVMGRERFFLEQFNQNYKVFAECERNYRFLQVAPRPVMEAVCVTGLLIVVALKLLNGTTSDYFISTIAVFAIAAFRLLPSFNRIANYFSVILFNKSALNAVYKDLKEIEHLQNAQFHERAEKELPLEKELRIEHLTFTYPEMEGNVLDDVSFSIKKNTSVAFIGPSGAGKTTLADIILGALTPLGGKIYADQTDIFENLARWHKSIGYIPQSIYLMDDTVKNNIAFGIAQGDVDEGEIWRALEKAQLKEFVEQMEFGLETMIGESGVKLSGGQRQRIGIARALYNDPQILVLDEATSALDTETETAVMEAIESLAGSKTLIIIAHRLSTIRNCDVVYEVKGGHVVQVENPKAN
ncbi:ABC transporter ATP-binding protein [Parablautia intestinalis]|uniref:ABC transporter ATP-binding protein n=1 Tax=Parablautia intestinalis TaxID=2320100 RepID=UPI00259D2BD9|nr:ABC transporter ATP-binding protein [Parablautia intestinalis]